jgi:hypothetical protein
MVTTAKNYLKGNTVAFETSFPRGAGGTSFVRAQNKTDSNQEVVANFPAFTNWTLAGVISWAGSFVGAQQGKLSTGPTGGPTVFFDPADAGLETVVVGSALDNFKDTSAGPGHTWDGTTPAWAPGISGTITSLPADFTQTIVLTVGSGPGITAAIGEWGELLQAYHQAYKAPDVTLEKIGYQTDNGAYYVFCSGNCSRRLLDTVGALKASGVPMGYLSFQGAGASHLDRRARPQPAALPEAPAMDPVVAASDGVGAPWCIGTWGPDAGTSNQFPLPETDFQKALGIPLQLYAPYFCDQSAYFTRVNASASPAWQSYQSDITLPGCGGFGFQDVIANQSLDFYRWFYKKGVETGMVSFEPDFMNQNYNCVKEFVESAGLAREWQMGMATAALEMNLTVQWCYATPTDILGALEMPAVTNFRVSNDFCYGESWRVGVSSLIVWAAGGFPSKDTLWTSNNAKFSVGGCPWTPDHETPAAALHVVIALMSTGPVGISDMEGGTNVTLIKRAITEDGTLLKPSKPISLVDSGLAATSVGNGNEAALPGPSGEIYSTYSAATPPTKLGLKAATAYYFVSFKMTAEFGVSKRDFYPALSAAKLTLVFREFSEGEGCVNGSAAHTCVATASSDAPNQIFTAPKSDLSNVTGGTDFAPAVTTVWPVCANGCALLGDLSKYVALSAQRFSRVECTATGVAATVVVRRIFLSQNDVFGVPSNNILWRRGRWERR